MNSEGQCFADADPFVIIFSKIFSKAVNSVLRLFECQSNGLVITTKNHLQNSKGFKFSLI